ncbi:oxidoreductase [Modestobacter sp. VKM Ac-2978]|uniref:oxidoreductase n=1 Tax=Modestobacter sp. VKM Ac-2978 TaxID=3004132 RepID=UPI0022AAB8B5|nr:oxidoreductase [Modestobacter sp. VKM Ac-2978]MCZ2847536.1 oxidoreductase [Modestobacter sp. VKM Ac-2978]
MQSAAGEDGGSAMGLIDRLRSRGTRGAAGGGRSRRGTLDRASGSADLSHLEQFVATRRGVEGYVEPRTAVTETTILLVAADGEWTRRRIDGPDTARKLSRDLAVPVYDAQITGYPQRMRDWSARQKADDKL